MAAVEGIQVHCITVAYEDGSIDRPNSQLMPANFGLFYYGICLRAIQTVYL